jgi:hypothetical protein
VQGELFADAGGHGLDLGAQDAQHGHVGQGDGGVGVGVLAVQAAGGVGQAGVQVGGVDAAAVADRAEPGGQPSGRQPVGLGLGGEALQEAQADLGVDVGEQAGRGRTCRWARSWLAVATRCSTRSLRARVAERSAVAAALSRTNGVSRRRSVRTVSASTWASNRSSLFPAEP